MSGEFVESDNLEMKRRYVVFGVDYIMQRETHVQIFFKQGYFYDQNGFVIEPVSLTAPIDCGLDIDSIVLIDPLIVNITGNAPEVFEIGLVSEYKSPDDHGVNLTIKGEEKGEEEFFVCHFSYRIADSEDVVNVQIMYPMEGINRNDYLQKGKKRSFIIPFRIKSDECNLCPVGNNCIPHLNALQE